SHGFDIAGRNLSMIEPRAQATVPLIAEITVRLKADLGKIPGVIIEEKKFSAAAHYRLVEDAAALDKIKKAAEDIVAGNDKLRLMAGKKVYEILPAIDWNKGEAVRWIMKALDMDWEDTAVIYIGDDATDEDAFSVVRGRGAAILVACEPKISAANFQLSGPDEVKKFFEMLLAGNN
ncbi:MAG: trehalose-phosphatase, partial [Candidatus Omnitrophica bacterium]|nr:trehalose-phosphatase [Candidatus Omnitrophota bacterium]